MKITVACVGRLKEKYLSDAQAEYVKRLGRYAKVRVIEAAEEKAQGSSAAATDAAVQAEGKKLLAAIAEADFCVAMCIEGSKMDSVSFARMIDEKKTAGVSSICFVIGGSDGLSEEVKAACGLRLSFSDFTVAHQLFRILLLEQIYRACKISAGETYHK